MRSSFTQTDVPQHSDNECQIPKRSNHQVQTDKIEEKHNIFADFDKESLSVFLRRITPIVCTILEKNSRSKAFDRYKLSSDTDGISISLLYLLEKPLIEKFCCSSLSWNSVGTAVAAAYSTTIHDNWCEHKSSVSIWSINRKDFDPKKPNITLETDCCISCVSFHPKLPAILVAGKLNGEILLWDISNEDDMLLSSTETCLLNHHEPVTGIHWLGELNELEKIKFASCSLDGKILLWSYENNSLTPYDGFIISTKYLPRNFNIKMHKGNAEVGITSMDVNVEDCSIFIIAIEGGGIFQCSFDFLMSSDSSIVDPFHLKNPINMGFERHKGQVSAVQFSPFSRNIFLSSGSDGEIRIYSLLQPKPLMMLHMPTSINYAEWAASRPMVFMCVCTSGKLHIWDLTENDRSAIESCPLNVGKESGLALKRNLIDSSLLATSSADGTLQIWQLSGAITMNDDGELQQLQTLYKYVN